MLANVPLDYMKLDVSRLNKMPYEIGERCELGNLKRPSSCKSVKTVAFVKIR